MIDRERLCVAIVWLLTNRAAFVYYEQDTPTGSVFVGVTYRRDVLSVRVTQFGGMLVDELTIQAKEMLYEYMEGKGA